MLQKKLGDKLYNTSGIDNEFREIDYTAENRKHLEKCISGVNHIKKQFDAMNIMVEQIRSDIGRTELGPVNPKYYDINRDKYIELKIAADKLTKSIIQLEHSAYDYFVQGFIKKILPDDIAPISGEESSNDSKK